MGEEVGALDGQTFRLTSITPRAGPEPVFNLEVANQHTYYVSRDGLLVHNAIYLTKAGREGKLAKKTTAKLKDVQRAKKAEGIDMHHSIPRGIQERLRDAGNDAAFHPDIIGRAGLPNRIPVPRARHREIHGGSGFVGKDLDGVGGGYYNNAFHQAILGNGG